MTGSISSILCLWSRPTQIKWHRYFKSWKIRSKDAIMQDYIT